MRMTIRWSAMWEPASRGMGMHEGEPWCRAQCVREPKSSQDSWRMWDTHSMNSFGLRRNNILINFILIPVRIVDMFHYQLTLLTFVFTLVKSPNLVISHYLLWTDISQPALIMVNTARDMWGDMLSCKFAGLACLVIFTLVAWWMADDKAKEDNGPPPCCHGDFLCWSP